MDEPQQRPHDVLHDGGVQPVDDVLPIPTRRHQARAAQDRQVPGDGRLRHGEVVDNLPDGHVAAPEEPENLAAGGVGERLEGRVAHLEPEHREHGVEPEVRAPVSQHGGLEAAAAEEPTQDETHHAVANQEVGHHQAVGRHS